MVHTAIVSIQAINLDSNNIWLLEHGPKQFDKLKNQKKTCNNSGAKCFNEYTHALLLAYFLTRITIKTMYPTIHAKNISWPGRFGEKHVTWVQGRDKTTNRMCGLRGNDCDNKSISLTDKERTKRKRMLDIVAPQGAEPAKSEHDELYKKVDRNAPSPSPPEETPRGWCERTGCRRSPRCPSRTLWKARSKWTQYGFWKFWNEGGHDGSM